MDSYSLGHLIGEIEARLRALEADWAAIKLYGRRAMLLLALLGANFLLHLDAKEMASLLQWALQVFG